MAQPLIIEADPAGGDIAARAGLALDPGLVTLAAAARKGLDPTSMARHIQPMASGIDVLVAPTDPSQTISAVIAIGQPLAALLADRGGLTLIDLGRSNSSTAGLPLTRVADLAIVVCRPGVASVEHARLTLGGLRAAGVRAAALVIGTKPYSPTEIASALGEPRIFAVEHDRRAAELVVSGVAIDRWLERSALMRSARAALTRCEPWSVLRHDRDAF